VSSASARSVGERADSVGLARWADDQREIGERGGWAVGLLALVKSAYERQRNGLGSRRMGEEGQMTPTTGMPGAANFNFDDSEIIVADPVTGHAMQASVVVVLFRGIADQVSSAVGTAFCIGSNPKTGEALFVTARHVIDSLDKAQAEGDGTASVHEVGIEAFLVLPEPLESGGWAYDESHGVPIAQISKALKFCDVALLVVNVNDGETAGLAPTRLPPRLAPLKPRPTPRPRTRQAYNTERKCVAATRPPPATR